MRNKKRVISFFLVCVMLLIHSISVIAAGSQKGSIEIVLTDGDIGTSKENVTFEYAKVADLVDGQYQLLDDYGEVDLNNIQYSAELDKAAQKINELAKADNKVMTDKNGKATISDLEIGVYLLRVSDKARYENVAPVLIAIPTWDETSGNMNYSITVTPKHTQNEPGTIITNTPNNKGEGNFSKIPTGDRFMSSFWCAVFVGTALVIVVMLYIKRRKNYEK